MQDVVATGAGCPLEVLSLGVRRAARLVLPVLVCSGGVLILECTERNMKGKEGSRTCRNQACGALLQDRMLAGAVPPQSVGFACSSLLSCIGLEL